MCYKTRYSSFIDYNEFCNTKENYNDYNEFYNTNENYNEFYKRASPVDKQKNPQKRLTKKTPTYRYFG